MLYSLGAALVVAFVVSAVTAKSNVGIRFGPTYMRQCHGPTPPALPMTVPQFCTVPALNSISALVKARVYVTFFYYIARRQTPQSSFNLSQAYAWNHSDSGTETTLARS